MIKSLIFSGILAIAVIVGVSIYLQPDDLANCSEQPSNVQGCQAVDAIIAVSGGDTNARVKEAINLYQNGWSNVLIFSGAAEDKTGPSNAAAMKDLAIKAGVPESMIYVDENSNTTKQNAQNVQIIFSELNIKSAILVTSGYHQRRVSLEFNKLTNGVKLINHPIKTDKDWSFWWFTSPRGWWLAGSEIAKIIVFYTVGS